MYVYFIANDNSASIMCNEFSAGRATAMTESHTAAKTPRRSAPPPGLPRSAPPAAGGCRSKQKSSSPSRKKKSGKGMLISVVKKFFRISSKSF